MSTQVTSGFPSTKME